MAGQVLTSRKFEQALSEKARRLLAAHDREVESRKTTPPRSGMPASMPLQPA